MREGKRLSAGIALPEGVEGAFEWGGRKQRLRGGANEIG